MYFTKESNILLSFWRQILNFKHDFANLKSATEKDLNSFKVCICQNIQNVMNLQNSHTSQEVCSFMCLHSFLMLIYGVKMEKLNLF